MFECKMCGMCCRNVNRYKEQVYPILKELLGGAIPNFEIIPSINLLSNKVSYSDSKLSIKIEDTFDFDNLSKKIELNKVAVEYDGFNIHTVIIS